VSNERIARVAQTIEDYRARFQYNLEDEHVRALAADVPIVAQWDDHETHNNWWPHQQLEDERYANRDASEISRLAHRAMYEWTPLPPGPVYRVVHYGPLLDIVVMDCRSYRSPNVGGDAASDMLGAEQARWLVNALAASRARWKLVACDQPLSLVIPDGPDNSRREGFADGTPAIRGREVELSRVLSGLRAASVKNAVWSPPTSTTRPRITTIRNARRSATSIRSGNSSPGRSTPARSGPTRSIRRSGPSRRSRGRRRRRTSRRGAATTTSARSTWQPTR
jgi:alkaline phosphatase D